MKWFIENATPANIGIALSLAVIIWGCIMWILHTLDHLDAQWAAETSLDGEICCKGDEQDLADLRRGTKQ
jgi:hypothetical protein